MKATLKRYDFAEIYHQHEKYKLDILQFMGVDHYGFALDNLVIDYLEKS